MTVVWSDGASFGGSYAAGPHTIDLGLSFAAGLVAFGTGRLLLAMGVTAAPGTSASQRFEAQLSSSGQTSTNDSDVQLGTTSPLAPLLGGLGLGLVSGPSGNARDFSAGGSLQIVLSLFETETVTGVLVAALTDDPGFNMIALGLTSPLSNTPPASGTFQPGSPGPITYADYGFAGAGSTASPAASPSFSGSADWTDLISRVNGGAFAVIGQYTGAIDLTERPWSVSASSGFGVVDLGAAWALPGAGRSFGMIIDD